MLNINHQGDANQKHNKTPFTPIRMATIKNRGGSGVLGLGRKRRKKLMLVDSSVVSVGREVGGGGRRHKEAKW